MAMNQVETTNLPKELQEFVEMLKGATNEAIADDFAQANPEEVMMAGE